MALFTQILYCIQAIGIVCIFGATREGFSQTLVVRKLKLEIMPTKLLFYLFAFFLFISCKKDTNYQGPDERYLNGVFVADSIYKIGTPVMYTSNGIINNQQIIKDYLLRHVPQYSDFIWDSTSIHKVPPFKIEIFDTNRAIITLTENYPDFPRTRNIVVKLVQNSASLTVFRSIDSLFNQEFLIDCNQLADLIKANIIVSNCIVMSTSTLPTQFCKLITEYPITKSNGQFSLSYLNFVISKGPYILGNYCRRSESGVITQLNESPLQNLGTADTVIIQKLKSILNKQ